MGLLLEGCRVASTSECHKSINCVIFSRQVIHRDGNHDVSTSSHLLRQVPCPSKTSLIEVMNVGGSHGLPVEARADVKMDGRLGGTLKNKAK